MMLAVWVPLLLPLLAAPAARRLAEHLAPRAAAWLLVSSAVVLGACSTAALGLLAGAGALRWPPVAVLGRLVLPVVEYRATGPAACAAAVLLAAIAAALFQTVRRRVRGAARARRAAASGTSGGDLTVLDDAGPDAYALPGRRGTIVVTTGMLRALDPAEREVLLAHERAHLAGGHHRFLTALALARVCHPALRILSAPLAYALERWADESAAARVGDRRVAARAIGRAALAAKPSTPRPLTALPATAGPVPRRVAALLAQPRRRRAPRTLVAGLAACLALSAACSLEAARDFHGSIEVAQGAGPPGG
jgi:Zn-dependent protease with chaperone function